MIRRSNSSCETAARKGCAKRQHGAAAGASIAGKTLLHDIATFGEFCNPQRRISHVLMFYGFVLYSLPLW